MATEIYTLKMIEIIQQELEQLKKTLSTKSRQKPMTLRGMWKGVDISDEEIEEAKSSLLKETYSD